MFKKAIIAILVTSFSWMACCAEQAAAAGGVGGGGGSLLAATLKEENEIEDHLSERHRKLQEQLGGNIEGTISGGEFGASISMSSDGTRVIVAAPYSNNNKGAVQRFEWNEVSTSWDEIIPSIEGVNDNDLFGSSVAISGDGTTFAVGAPGSSTDEMPKYGYATVYEWEDPSSSLTRFTHESPLDKDKFGFVVDVSENGETLAVGSKTFSGTNKDGFVKVIFDAKYGEWLGCHMIGAGVTDMIAEAVVARKLETTGHEVLKAIHPHPTMSEAVMEAVADAYDEVIHL